MSKAIYAHWLDYCVMRRKWDNFFVGMEGR
jgi:hypothetical protein